MTYPKANHSRSVGTLMIFFNSIWLFSSIHRFYGQNYGRILYLFMYPNWLIATAPLCAIAGIILGIYVLKRRIKVKHGVLINTTLIIFHSALTLHITT